MKRLEPQTIETAPEKSKEILRDVQKSYGFIPNLLATFANSPAVLSGYMSMEAAWATSSLSAKERHLVLLAASVENRCNYCQAAHSTVLKNFMKVDSQIINAVKSGNPLPDARLNALVHFTKEAVNERGYVSEGTRTAFVRNGFSEVQMMEVLVGIALKTLSNYLDHINPVEIDTAFVAEA